MILNMAMVEGLYIALPAHLVLSNAPFLVYHTSDDTKSLAASSK